MNMRAIITSQDFYSGREQIIGEIVALIDALCRQQGIGFNCVYSAMPHALCPMPKSVKSKSKDPHKTLQKVSPDAESGSLAPRV